MVEKGVEAPLDGVPTPPNNFPIYCHGKINQDHAKMRKPFRKDVSPGILRTCVVSGFR